MQETNDNYFYYPENLTEKTTFIAGWEWWALAIMAGGLLLSVYLIMAARLVLPLLFTVLFAFASFRVDNISVATRALLYARWLFAEQMIYFWEPEIERKELIHGKTK